jgi:hypothetical protein
MGLVTLAVKAKFKDKYRFLLIMQHILSFPRFLFNRANSFGKNLG